MSAPIPVKRFIPFTKHDLLQMTLKSMQWTESEQQSLTSIAALLNDLFHFEFHRDLETLKNTYVELNPDRDTRQVFPIESDGKKIRPFSQISLKAYSPLQITMKYQGLNLNRHLPPSLW